MHLADHDQPQLAAFPPKPGDDLERVKGAFWRHHLAHEEQHLLAIGDAMACPELAHVMMFCETARVDAERNDGARAQLEAVGRHQFDFMGRLRNHMRGLAHEPAAEERIKGSSLPGRRIQRVDGRGDVRYRVQAAFGMGEHGSEEVVADRMGDVDAAHDVRQSHLQQTGHEVVGGVAAERCRESSDDDPIAALLALRSVRRTSGREDLHVMAAKGEILRETAGVGAQPSDGRPELVAKQRDAHGML